MKFGDTLRGSVTHLDDKGCGLLTYHLPHDESETREVVIPFTLPGDEVEATFVRREQGRWIARLERVLQPSAQRVVPPCPQAGVCGGCLWQHIAYDAQLQIKRDAINRALNDAGHDERVTDVVPSSETLHYRNRMDYVVGWQGELGLKEYGAWNRYLDTPACLLLDDESSVILKQIKTWMQFYKMQPWDAKKQTGNVRYCVIRLGRNTAERMVTLVVKDANQVTEAARQTLIETLSPLTTTLYLGENPLITDLSLAQSLTLLHGKPFLTEEVNGLRYDIHPNSFFQTNTAMSAVLQSTVLNFLPLSLPAHGILPTSLPAYQPTSLPTILDLYCGLGFFGLACAQRGAQVYGHELDTHAIELARQNAAKNNLSERASFGSGPVEDLDWTNLHPDALILDPPRSGLHPRALKAIIASGAPTIVYVSCNFRALAKELKDFKSVYRISELQALDLFPQTPHVEVVVKLEQKKYKSLVNS